MLSLRMKDRLEISLQFTYILDLLIPSGCQRFVPFPRRRHGSRSLPAPDSLIFPRKKAVGATATYLNLISMLGVKGATPPLPLVCMTCTRTNLPL